MALTPTPDSLTTGGHGPSAASAGSVVAYCADWTYSVRSGGGVGTGVAFPPTGYFSPNSGPDVAPENSNAFSQSHVKGALNTDPEIIFDPAIAPKRDVNPLPRQEFF
eukprot:scaffold131500_cov32-Attheya_sp.AAC.1